MKNCDAFLALQDAYLGSQSSYLGKMIVDTILSIFQSDRANYFILVSHHHSLSIIVEVLPTKNIDVQVCVCVSVCFIGRVSVCGDSGKYVDVRCHD